MVWYEGCHVVEMASVLVIIGLHNVAAGTVAGIVDSVDAGIVDYEVVGIVGTDAVGIVGSEAVDIVGSEAAIGPHTAICNA